MAQRTGGLEPADLHRLRAAQGWLELGLPRDAARELQAIQGAALLHASTLDMRWAVAAALTDWSEAHGVGETSVQQHPRHEWGWSNRSYAARRMPGGGLVLAQQQLSPALSLFPKSSLIPYNLACYACQLGDIEEAMRCFSIAETRHGKSPKKTECIRTRALEDADLAPVHDWIRNLPKSRKK